VPNKDPRSILDQIELLKRRGMSFKDEPAAYHQLQCISYYRLKGYWWDLQLDSKQHQFLPNVYFEDVIALYNFDRQLRIILFDAIERIEIALRTKMIYHLSLAYGGLWYLNADLFSDAKLPPLFEISIFEKSLQDLQFEFSRSQEVFVKDHKKRFPGYDADAWKILEVASMGNLSKLYKNLKHQLPEKSIIAKELGLSTHKELSSWLEAITYVRNIIAHHSRLWSRNMVKTPMVDLNNPSSNWLNLPVYNEQKNSVFLIVSAMIYLSNQVTQDYVLKNRIKDLIDENPDVSISKLGFIGNWKEQSLWK
jgi:abortive infection bacteriophage resistance protein